MKKVFIDGSEGTTGLRIFERFEGRDDIEILKIPSELRKNPDEIKKYINASDITFLCLPDAAAREAVAMVENDNTIIIDTSTGRLGVRIPRAFVGAQGSNQNRKTHSRPRLLRDRLYHNRLPDGCQRNAPQGLPCSGICDVRLQRRRKKDNRSL